MDEAMTKRRLTTPQRLFLNRAVDGVDDSTVYRQQTRVTRNLRDAKLIELRETGEPAFRRIWRITEAGRAALSQESAT